MIVVVFRSRFQTYVHSGAHSGQESCLHQEVVDNFVKVYFFPLLMVLFLLLSLLSVVLLLLSLLSVVLLPLFLLSVVLLFLSLLSVVILSFFFVPMMCSASANLFQLKSYLPDYGRVDLGRKVNSKVHFRHWTEPRLPD